MMLASGVALPKNGRFYALYISDTKDGEGFPATLELAGVYSDRKKAESRKATSFAGRFAAIVTMIC